MLDGQGKQRAGEVCVWGGGRERRCVFGKEKERKGKEAVTYWDIGRESGKF